MDSYYLVIVGTIVGFFALAAALLVPVYRFLKKEEQTAELWTEESVVEAQTDSTTVTDEGPPPGAQSSIV